jgi:hypothetical protein
MSEHDHPYVNTRARWLQIPLPEGLRANMSMSIQIRLQEGKYDCQRVGVLK